MSGLAAIVRFDGSDVPEGAIERVTAAQAYRGIDGIAHWRSGPVALGFCALHALDPATAPPLPLVSDDGQRAVVFTGYLHHRDDLVAALTAKGSAPRTDADAELVLRAYECWGEDCAVRIEGEFAFVVWDGRTRRVFCARDHGSLRPLYYHFDGRQLVVASDFAAILDAPGVKQEPNLRMIAQIMANETITPAETVWKGIVRLLPATCASIDRSGMRSRTYWAPPAEVTLRYPRDEDYFEHYRALLGDCVREASRSHRPVGIDVSGGLDSSAIFAMANRLAESGQLLAPEFKGYTFRFEAGSAPDELDYARAVAAHVGRPVAEIAPFLPEMNWFVAQGLVNRDACPFPNVAMTSAIGRALVADGCRVWINGEGGDEWLGGRPFYYSEQLAAGDLTGAARSFQDDRAAFGWRTALWRLYRYGLGPHAPAALRALRRKVMARGGPNQFESAFWLDSSLDRLLAELRSERDNSQALAYTNIARRAMYMELKDPFDNIARDLVERQCAQLGYEPRSPMFARRFIEFAFSTPERTRLRGDQRKFTHVGALQGLLPESVRTRKTKADFSLAFERHLDKMQTMLVDDLPARNPERLSAPGMARLFAEYQFDPDNDGPVWELWGVFACLAPGHLDANENAEIVE